MVNLIEALVSYYDQLVANGVELEPYGWEKRANVKYVIDIDDNGDIVQFIPWSDEVSYTDQKGKEKTRIVYRQILVPKMPVRTAGIRSIPLCDTIAYLAGIDAKTGTPEKKSLKFNASKELALHILGDGDGNLAAEAIIKYYSNMTDRKMAQIAEKFPDAVTDIGFFVLGYNGRPITEDWYVTRKYDEYIHRVGMTESEMYGKDIITGQKGRISRVHGRINSIPAVSGSGAPLCCANSASLESYAGIVGYENEDGEVVLRPDGGAGLHRGYGYPMTEETEHKYSVALKYLTSSPIHYLKSTELFGKASVLFWAKNATEEQDQRFAALMGMDTWKPADSTDDFKNALVNLTSGKFEDPVSDEDPEYIVVAFDSRDGFVLRAKYLETRRLSDLTRDVKRHYEECAMVDYPGNPSPYAIMRSTLPQKSDGSYKVDGQKSYNDLLRAVAFGWKYPEDVTRQVLDRAVKDGSIGDGIRGIHAAYLRGYLIRNCRKEIAVALDINNNEPAYLMGRVLAYGDYLQYQSNKPHPVTKSLSALYLREVSFYPGVCMPHIVRKIQYYCQKLDRKAKNLAVYYYRDYNDIMSRLPSDGWPQKFTREEQALFITGFYQQQKEFFSRGKKADEAEADV